MTLKSNQGFILGYKFGFVGKLNAPKLEFVQTIQDISFMV